MFQQNLERFYGLLVLKAKFYMQVERHKLLPYEILHIKQTKLLNNLKFEKN